MLHFTKGNTSQAFIVTLNEKKTLTAPYYLFVFTNISTSAQVKFIVNSTADLSSYPSRFNRFTINIATLFSGKDAGQYLYQVYEQASAVNTDPTGLTMLENGRMELHKSSEFEFEGYEAAQSIKGYGG